MFFLVKNISDKEFCHSDPVMSFIAVCLVLGCRVFILISAQIKLRQAGKNKKRNSQKECECVSLRVRYIYCDENKIIELTRDFLNFTISIPQKKESKKRYTRSQ